MRRKDNILIRKATGEFKAACDIQNAYKGYCERIENYNPTKLKSLAESLDPLTIRQKIGKLLAIVDKFNNSLRFPNIFCDEKILDGETLLPFSEEFLESNALIVQESPGQIRSYANTKDNFINCFLRVSSTVNDKYSLKDIHDKYIKKLPKKISILSFVELFYSQLNAIGNNENYFFYDVAAGAALYSSINEPIALQKIDIFVDIYHRFNKELKDCHLYSVSQELFIGDETPLCLLRSIAFSLEIIRVNLIPSLAFFLDKDVLEYGDILLKLAENIAPDKPIDLDMFHKVFVKVYFVNDTVKIENRRYSFNQIKLLNPVSREITTLTSSHLVWLDSSEHVYAYLTGDDAYLVAMHSSISKMYDSITKRVQYFSENGNVVNSFPGVLSSHIDFENIENFHRAIDVIATHQDVNNESAKSILLRWLECLPQEFHQPLTTLISAHHVMSNEDINLFIDKVKSVISQKSLNPFLTKDVGDHNGTHRLLYKDGEIGRAVSGLSPLNIAEDATVATIITDLIITGSQIISALKYYTVEDSNEKSSNYFDLEPADKIRVKDRLRSLQKLNICTVLYTRKGLDNIRRECSSMLTTGIEIVVINGRDLGDDAFFGSTQTIGEAQKNEIRMMLQDKTKVDLLFRYFLLRGYQGHHGHYSSSDINATNLIARYRSMPKKCFKFLCVGLKQDDKCHPMIRLFETNETN